MDKVNLEDLIDLKKLFGLNFKVIKKWFICNSFNYLYI